MSSSPLADVFQSLEVESRSGQTSRSISESMCTSGAPGLESSVARSASLFILFNTWSYLIIVSNKQPLETNNLKYKALSGPSQALHLLPTPSINKLTMTQCSQCSAPPHRSLLTTAGRSSCLCSKLSIRVSTLMFLHKAHAFTILMFSDDGYHPLP